MKPKIKNVSFVVRDLHHTRIAKSIAQVSVENAHALVLKGRISQSVV